MRTLTFQGQSWRYHIGRAALSLRGPDGRRVVIPLTELTGRTPQTLERGRWKKTSDGSVTPAHLATFLRAKLLPWTFRHPTCYNPPPRTGRPRRGR